MDDARRQRIARQHVKTDQLLGLDAAPLGPPRDWPPPPQASAPKGVAPQEAAESAPGGSADADARRQAKLRILTAMDVDEVKGCTKCPLCDSRTQTVFGEGDPDAALLFIGEGPGQTEDEKGRPFVGRAGELLNKMIVAMGLSREQVYIANVVKCRPPNNRTPTPGEVDACWDYLRRQIETIQPRVIVTLGGPATKMLLNTRQGITAIRGTWHQYQPDPLVQDTCIPLMPTFHPAYLLRSYTQENRRKVWSDLQKAMARLSDEAPAG